MANLEPESTHGLSRRKLLKTGMIGLGVATVGIASPVLTETAQAITYQPHWGFCNYCAGLYNIDVANTAGSDNFCPNPTFGGHGGTVTYNYLIPHDVGGNYPQPNWRWCTYCDALYYGGHESTSRCPNSQSNPYWPHHNRGVSFNYSLFYYSGPTGTNDPQLNWRWCGRCQGLFYDGSLPRGASNICPAGSGGHTPGSGSYDYGLDWTGF
jgi:hypothetical protein